MQTPRSRILSLGTYDLMHPGHVGLFKRCKDLAGDHGAVIVAVNTDDFIARYKGRPPILNYTERSALVAAVRHVDQVIPNDGTDQPALIAEVNPTMIVIGSDWATKDYYGQLGITQDFLDQNDITMTYVPRTGEWSTTELKARLAVGK